MIELNPVKGQWRVGQADMLGAQIAMALENQPFLAARKDRATHRGQLHRRALAKRIRQAVAKMAAHLRQMAEIGRHLAGQTVEIRRTRMGRCDLVAIECDHDLAEIRDLIPAGLWPIDKAFIKHQRLGQAEHFNQPVDHPPGTTQIKRTIRMAHQRHEAKIDITRKRAVQAQLFGAKCGTYGKAAHIGMGQHHRLFQLIGAIMRQEDQRGMGLDTVRRRPIWPCIMHQESVLFCQTIAGRLQHRRLGLGRAVHGLRSREKTSARRSSDQPNSSQIASIHCAMTAGASARGAIGVSDILSPFTALPCQSVSPPSAGH